MKLVYFEEQLSNLAPGLIGAFCVDPGAQWVTFADITAALDRGEHVAIRPASAAEKTRVESVVALSRIADQLAAKIGGLLDRPEAPAPQEEVPEKTRPLDIAFHGGDAQSGSVFAVETRAEAGHMLESHVHEHSHMSVLVSGTADVTIDGRTERMTGYRLLTIPANTRHSVQAVTDVVWLCLWADDIAPKQLAKESLKLVPAHD